MEPYNSKDVFSLLYEPSSFRPGFLGAPGTLSEAGYRHWSLFYQRGYYPFRRRKPEKQPSTEKIYKDVLNKPPPTKAEIVDWYAPIALPPEILRVF